ncbi:MAG: VOC family protein [Pseudomonadota bacterium]
MRPGYHTLSAYLVSHEAEAIKRFAETAFGAEEVHPALRTPERLVHVALKIGDSVLLLAAPPEGMGEESAFLHLYVEDCDAAHARALAAGAESIMPPAPQDHGDRACMVRDPGGNKWWLATYIDTVSDAEILRRKGAAQQT